MFDRIMFVGGLVAMCWEASKLASPGVMCRVYREMLIGRIAGSHGGVGCFESFYVLWSFLALLSSYWAAGALVLAISVLPLVWLNPLEVKLTPLFVFCDSAITLAAIAGALWWVGVPS